MGNSSRHLSLISIFVCTAIFALSFFLFSGFGVKEILLASLIGLSLCAIFLIARSDQNRQRRRERIAICAAGVIVGFLVATGAAPTSTLLDIVITILFFIVVFGIIGWLVRKDYYD